MVDTSDDVMLKVSGLTITDKSEHSEQVRKVLKHVADIGRRIEEKHQVKKLKLFLKIAIVLKTGSFLSMKASPA